MTAGLLAFVLLWNTAAVVAPGPRGAARAELDVPIVVQAPERCGQAALEMVLRYYDADAVHVRSAESVHDPVLRGSLITTLAAAARRAGFDATIEKLAADSLIGLVAEGVPPIVLYQSGRRPLTVPHYGVVRAWDPERGVFVVNDGRRRPQVVGRQEFAKRWRTAGSQALVIRRKAP